MASTWRLNGGSLRWLRTLTARSQTLGTGPRYFIAVSAVAIGLLARLALEPVWQARLPYITLFPAVMVSAWLGGFGPGLLTTLLSALGAAYFWVVPLRSLRITDPGELVGLGVFVMVGAVISGLNEAWRRGIAAVVESEQRLAVTLASIGDAVVTTDERGDVTGMNDVAERLTGWSSPQAVGRPVEDVIALLSERTGHSRPNPVRQVLQSGKPMTLETTPSCVLAMGGAFRLTTAWHRSGSLRGTPPARSWYSETSLHAVNLRPNANSRIE